MNINISGFNTKNRSYRGSQTFYQVNKPWQALIITTIAIIVGVGVLIYGINSNIKSKNYIETTGVVVDYEHNIDTYYPIVEYNVDGVKYRSTSSTSADYPEETGYTIVLKYNPDNPSEVSWNTGLSSILIPACGIFFIVVGFIGSINFLKKGISEGFNSGTNEKHTYNGLNYQEDDYQNFNNDMRNNFSNQDFYQNTAYDNNDFNNTNSSFNNQSFNQNTAYDNNDFNNTNNSFNNQSFNQNTTNNNNNNNNFNNL